MDLETIAHRIAAEAKSLRVIVWDEVSGEWGDLETMEVSARKPHYQYVAVALNRKWEEIMSGEEIPEDEEPGWRVISVDKVDALESVKPSDYDKSQAKSEEYVIAEAQNKGEPEPVFTQDQLTGPGYVSVVRSDRNHLSLMLFQEKP